MNIMRKYLLSNVYRSPDDPAADPGADPIVAADPAVAADPVADPVDPEPAPVVVPKTDATPKWALERIGEETSRRQAAEESARVAIARANSLEEITRRLQAKPADPANPNPPVEPVARPPAPTLDQTAVQAEAARQIFERDAQAVSNAGSAAYGKQWDDAINILNLCGANSSEFVANVMEIDQAKAHEIMFTIAQDGERAAKLAKMTPTRRIAEITRMTMTTAPADPKPIDPKPIADPKPAVSRAPAPKPVVAPHASAPEVDPTTPEGDAKMDDKAWEKWYKDKYMKRA